MPGSAQLGRLRARYNDLDIALDLLARSLQLGAAPHAPCSRPDLVAMVLGCRLVFALMA